MTHIYEPHQFNGISSDAIRAWGEWYGVRGLFAFTALATAMTNCTTRYGFGIADGDGIGTIGELMAQRRITFGPAEFCDGRLV